MDGRKARKGKTYEELVGVKRARKWKKRIGKTNEKIMSGQGNPMYGVHRFGKDNPMYGKKRPDQSERMRKNNPMRQSEVATKRSRTIEEKGLLAKENNPNWQGGKSFELYGIEFDEDLKFYIRDRDNFSCQLCPVIENGKAFDNHHIDYDKKNNNERNLILLCRSCNNKAQVEREKWQFLFETLQEIRHLIYPVGGI